MVFCHLDNFAGDTFSPTASKKVVWLFFAVGVLHKLVWQWFDVQGAFMAEKPTRDVYVTMDGHIYKLIYSLFVD